MICLVIVIGVPVKHFIKKTQTVLRIFGYSDLPIWDLKTLYLDNVFPIDLKREFSLMLFPDGNENLKHIYSYKFLP